MCSSCAIIEKNGSVKTRRQSFVYTTFEERCRFSGNKRCLDNFAVECAMVVDGHLFGKIYSKELPIETVS